MKILITGAAGFIGSNLAETLIIGNEIVGMDNFDPFYDRAIKEHNLEELNKADNFHFYEADLLDKQTLERIFSEYEFDAVIHLAAKAGVRPSIKDPIGYSKANIEGTINIFEACRAHNIENVLFASSSSVYGNNEKVPFSEKDNVDFPISPYAATKKSCELISNTYAHLYGLKIAALRFFTVYGRRQRPDLAIAKFTRLIDNGDAIPFYGDGTTRRDYTYIDDIIDGINKCLNWIKEQPKGTCEIFNLGESNTVTLNRLVETIESALGVKAIIDRQPMQAGDVKQTYADISKAKGTFGYAPSTLIDEGIREYVKYYRSITKIPSLASAAIHA